MGIGFGNPILLHLCTFKSPIIGQFISVKGNVTMHILNVQRCKKTMEQCENGDMLLYCDSGCEIDSKKADLFPPFFEIAKQDKIVSTKAHCCMERHWNKMNLLIELGLQHESAHLFHWNEQRQAGVALFYVCDETRHLVNKWFALASNHHLIDDSPSIAPNYHDFIEHRHDQSIFSLLTKQHSIFSGTQISCVEYIRNRSGTSTLP